MNTNIICTGVRTCYATVCTLHCDFNVVFLVMSSYG